MVNLTISLSDETVRRLRKAVRDRYAGKKGSLSGLIEESLREKLDAFDIPQTFKAMKGARLVAEAVDLDTLGRKLEEMNVDPRSVRIISSKKLAPIVRTGLRGRGT